MSNLYFGIEDPPKGKVRGSMIQSAQHKQVRYYGVNKIDPKILTHVKQPKGKNSDRNKLRLKMTELTVKIKKLKHKFTREKNEKKKKALVDEANKLVDEYNT